MRPRQIPIILVLTLAMLAILAVDAFAGRRVRVFGQEQSEQKAEVIMPNKDTKLKSFNELTIDRVAIEGLFTFYLDTVDNTVLMAIKPEQMGPIYLCGMARATGDGTYYDTGPPGRSFPFYFKRVGKNILLLEKNLRLRADSATTMYNAVASGISDHLFATSEVKSKPDSKTGAVLIEAEPLFIQDAENTSYRLGTQAKKGYSFDSKNSFFDRIKSFPHNSEIDIKLHFKSSIPNDGPTLQSGESFFHTYHFSLSTLPETDYVPRLDDDRVGYFTTFYQDYSELDRESSYVRYINRWHLKKKNPEARVSEPEQPIVFWIENTVPHEYRDAIAEGIEFWNQSFEKVGFRNAIVAKQMPDTADWDPLDVRYSTIRWMVSPGVYAIGPSRANPFTGQIYDADISISADFVRYMYTNMENFIKPVSYDGRILDAPDTFEEHRNGLELHCNYAQELAQEAAFGMAYLMSTAGDLADKDSLTREYVHSYLVELVAHEVGHTLGFRHNFKASTIYTLEQIQNREFTKKNSTTGTIMEYAPPNIAAKGQPQGEFFASVPGPFDDWRVEYGYSEFGAQSPSEELEQLKAIATRAGDDLLAYATDFDVTAFSVDPLTNMFDLGDDPLAYSKHKIELTRELWGNAIKDFEKPGESYEKIRRVFDTGWRSYREAAQYAARYVGGLYHGTTHIGDTDGDIPFTPVPASEQRRAIEFLRDYIFAADAFDVPAELLNRLQSPRSGDFIGTIYRSPMAYPWHQNILNIQQTALGKLYSAMTVGQLLNNIDRYGIGDEAYTMQDMFTDVRRSIWGEIVAPDNVNSQRRQLQLAHLNWIAAIYLTSPAVYPTDAITLAATDLDILEQAAKKAAASQRIDEITRAHFKEVIRQVEAAKGAKRNFAGVPQQTQ
ncbi:MAG: zinc-dependent metalloprotease [Candidatus Zixiibacteriota bacterium]